MTIGPRASPLATISLKREAEAVALSEAHPANAGGQALKLDSRARHVEPVMQVRIVRNQLLHLRVGLVDVLGVAGQRGPAERPMPRQNKGRMLGRHETGKSKARATPSPGPPGAGCSHSRIPAVRVPGSAACIRRAWPSSASRPALVPAGSLWRRSSHSSTVHPAADSR